MYNAREEVAKALKSIVDSTIHDDKQIDLYNLHIELAIQPALVEKWGMKVATAEYEREKAKEQMDLTKSNVEAAIRQSPGEYGLVKGTESEIAAAVARNEECVEALHKYQETVHHVNVLKVGREAVSSRKSSLENEVKLWADNYFATPTTESPLAREGVEQAREIKSKELQEAITRKRRERSK